MNRRGGSLPSYNVTEAFSLAHHPLGAAAGAVPREEAPSDERPVARNALNNLDSTIVMKELSFLFKVKLEITRHPRTFYP